MSEKASRRMSESAKKRRTVIDPSDGITAEELSEAGRVLQAGEISPEAIAPQQDDDEKPYTVGWWKGLRQWRCKQCPWDTLESEAAMLEHIAVRHAPPKPRVFVADKSGREKT